MLASSQEEFDKFKICFNFFDENGRNGSESIDSDAAICRDMFIIVLVLFGGLIVLTQGSAVAPFIYTIF